MAATTFRTTASPAPVGAVTAGDWTVPFLGTVMDAQFAQWSAMLAWQQSLATLNKDLWEQWACRYGGGVPIDV